MDDFRIDVEAIRSDAEALLSASADSTDGGPIRSHVGFTFGELRSLRLPEREEIICGLGRREIGILNAVTNVGKTTLIRNMAVSLVTGRPYPPLVPLPFQRRVAIIDGEDTLSFLRADILRMIFDFSDEEKKAVDDRLLVMCDAAIDGEDLTINNPAHFELILARLEDFGPDIVFVDTISRCFSIEDENRNSEVKEQVMKRLSRLAKSTDAAVIALHHIGKAKLEQGAVREGVHRGRGASTFADQSRVLFNLEKHADGERVTLSCPKLKGEAFADQIFCLNRARRWFEWAEEAKTASNYDLMLRAFSDGETHKTAEVVAALKDIPERTVYRLLGEGVKKGDLSKVKKGQYRLARVEA